MRRKTKNKVYLADILFKNCTKPVRNFYDDHILYLNEINHFELMNFFAKNSQYNFCDFKFGICEEREANRDLFLKFENDFDFVINFYSGEKVAKRENVVIGQLPLKKTNNYASFELKNEINFKALKQALGFELNDKQKRFLNKELITKQNIAFNWLRREGATTVYILSLLLNYEKKPLKEKDLSSYSDKPFDFTYSTKHFVNSFHSIRNKLLDNYFYLREVDFNN